MPRFAPLLVVVACSQSAPAPAPVAPPPPPAAAVPAGFASETPALADGALALIPARACAVAVARSLDDLDARLGPALATFTAATGLSPDGLAHAKPVGIALVDGGWVAFGYLEDRGAFERSVPQGQRMVHDQIALVADSAETLEAVDRGDGLSQDPGFRAVLAELHYGALLSAWRAHDGAIGIAVDGATLRERVVGAGPASKREADPAAARAEAIRAARGAGVLGALALGGTKALRERHDAAVKERDAARGELDAARARAVDEVVSRLQLDQARPFERTLTMPGATVGAWLAPAIKRWDAPEATAKLAALDAHIAELERKMAKTPAFAFSRVDPSMDEAAQRMADLLTSDMAMPEPVGEMRKRPGADLGQQISDVRATGTVAVGGGGGGRGMGMGSLGTRRSPQIAITGSGDARLRAHLTSRMSRMRTCYDRALETSPGLHAVLQLELDADADGHVRATAIATASYATLASCLELAANGTATGVHDASGTFTVELSPP